MNSWVKAENSTTVNTINLSHNTGCTSSKKKKDMHIKGWQKSLSRLTLTLIATDSWQIWTLVCKESLQNLNLRLGIFFWQNPLISAKFPSALNLVGSPKLWQAPLSLPIWISDWTFLLAECLISGRFPVLTSAKFPAKLNLASSP